MSRRHPRKQISENSRPLKLLVAFGALLPTFGLVYEGSQTRDLQIRMSVLEHASQETDRRVAAEHYHQDLRTAASKYASEHLSELRSPDRGTRGAAIRIFLDAFPHEIAVPILNTIATDDAFTNALLMQAEDDLPVSALVFNYRQNGNLAEKCAAILRQRNVPTTVLTATTLKEAGSTVVQYFERIDAPAAERVANWLSNAGCPSHARGDFQHALYPPNWRTFNVLIPEAS